VSGHSLVLRLSVIGAVLLVPAIADAQWSVGADASAVLPLSEEETHVGWMAGLHAGYRWPLGGLRIGPELGGIYGGFSPVELAHKRVYSFYAGGRAVLEISDLVSPYAYIHLGYGVAKTDNLYDFEDGFRSIMASGMLVDATVGACFRIAGTIHAGPQVGFATIEPGDCFCARWLHAGAAVSLDF
jgi:hypothetical protein